MYEKKVFASVLTLMLLCITLFGCDTGDNGAESESVPETESTSENDRDEEQESDPCVHVSTSVNEKCEEYCTACGEILATEMHDEGDFVNLTNYTAEPINKDGYFYLYRGDGSVTGRYMLIKYRTEYDGQWQIFAGANNGREESVNSDGFYLEDQIITVRGGIIADGEWRITILDLANLKPSSFKEDAEGIIAANGWVGVNGNLLGAAYMVVDKDGNVLRDWTEVSGNFAAEQVPITEAVQNMGHGIDPIGRRSGIKADVSEFAGQTVNVIYAVIPEDIPEESNDRYIPIIEIRGVSVPA